TIFACSDDLLISSLLCFPRQTMDALAEAFRSPAWIPCPMPPLRRGSVTGDTARCEHAAGERVAVFDSAISASRHPTPPATYPSVRLATPSPTLGDEGRLPVHRNGVGTAYSREDSRSTGNAATSGTVDRARLL